MASFIEKIRNFMIGRNGVDKLSVLLFFCYLLVNGIKMFFRFRRITFFVMWLVALVFLGLAVFRILSKDLYRRQQEEQRFEALFLRFTSSELYARLRKKCNRAYMRLSQAKTYRFRTCPQCKEHLRMSKKRGKRSITCPKCGKQFKVYIPF